MNIVFPDRGAARQFGRASLEVGETTFEWMLAIDRQDIGDTQTGFGRRYRDLPEPTYLIPGFGRRCFMIPVLQRPFEFAGRVVRSLSGKVHLIRCRDVEKGNTSPTTSGRSCADYRVLTCDTGGTRTTR